LPDEVLAAAKGHEDPDAKIVAMLGARTGGRGKKLPSRQEDPDPEIRELAKPLPDSCHAQIRESSWPPISAIEVSRREVLASKGPMLARLCRPSPRALLLAGAVVLALAAAVFVVGHEMRPELQRELDRLCPIREDIPLSVHFACIDNAGIGIYGYRLHRDWYPIYRQIDALGAFAGLSLLGAAALAARMERLSRLRAAP
jgi:hypothetical protein